MNEGQTHQPVRAWAPSGVKVTPWISPRLERAAETRATLAAARKRWSMTKATIAARRMLDKRNPWLRAKRPEMTRSPLDWVATREREEPAERTVVSTIRAAQPARQGMSPTATARACLAGVSEKAWAVMTIPTQRRMPRVTSRGMKRRTSPVAPERQIRARRMPLTVE